MPANIIELRILASLLAALSLASLVGYLLKRRHPSNPSIDNLNARIRAWWILILFGGAALLAGRIAVILLFAFVSLLASREFLAVGRRNRLPHPSTPSTYRRVGQALSPVELSVDRFQLFVCFIAIPVQYLLIAAGRYGMFTLWIPVTCIPALAIAGFRVGSGRTATAQGGLIFCVYFLSHIPALAMLRIPSDQTLLMVFIVLVAQVSDIFQYVWGKLLGKHKLLPTLSPSKTVEGLVGGVLSATALGSLLYPITPFNAWQAASMAFLIAILGFLGGLLMSAIKRNRGIKDWSGLLEGHGGMLDRVDSLCLSAPVFFHLTRHFFS
jgi:phosphatidate cytidylyltransferase